MADTKEQLDINFNVTGLEQTNAKLLAANASVEKLFRTLSETGEEIETPFLKGIDSINRLRGNLDDVSDQFKIFGARGLKIAESLEKISDPAKRLQLSQSLLAKEMKTSQGVFAKLGDKSAELQARFHALSPVAKGALIATAAGATAAAAAVAKLAQVVAGQLVDAWKAWAAQSQEAIQIQEDLDGKTERLQVSLGRLVEESAHITDAQVGFGASSTDLSNRIDDLTSSISGANEETAGGFNVLSQYTDQLVKLGQQEKQRLGLIQATNPLLLTQAALMDQLAASSLQAGSGLDAFEKAMNEAQVEAWKLNRALDELDKRWSESAFGAQNAVGATTERGGSAISKSVVDLEKVIEKNNKLQNEVDRDRENSYKFYDFEQQHLSDKVDKQLFYNQLKLDELAYNKLLREESGADLQIANAQGGVEQFSSTLKSVQSDGVNSEEYKQVAMEFLQARAQIEAALANPLITPEEALFLEEKANALDMKYQEFKTNFKDASSTQLSTASIDAATASMNEATKGAVLLGASMAGMALETLIAGDSLSNFGTQALQMFGNFATNAGQVLLATGIGQLALFSGNPGGAIAAGLSLIAIGSVLGGIAKRNLKKDGASGGGAAQANQIADRFAQNNRNQDQEPQPIIVYAQFGTERLEPAIANAVTSAQRNGRLPRN